MSVLGSYDNFLSLIHFSFSPSFATMSSSKPVGVRKVNRWTRNAGQRFATTTEFQHNDIMMKTTVQNDLRLEMALESVWIVCAHEKSNN